MNADAADEDGGEEEIRHGAALHGLKNTDEHGKKKTGKKEQRQPEGFMSV